MSFFILTYSKNYSINISPASVFIPCLNKKLSHSFELVYINNWHLVFSIQYDFAEKVNYYKTMILYLNERKKIRTLSLEKLNIFEALIKCIDEFTFYFCFKSIRR